MSDSLRPHGLHHAMPSFPVCHQLLEYTQTPLHRVSYAIQPSHPLSSPFPPIVSLSTTVIQVYAPTSNAEEAEVDHSMKTYRTF